MPIRVRRLEQTDDRSNFQCGEPELDRYFRQFAGQHQFRRHIGTTYVAVDDDGDILGFSSLSTGHIEVDSLPQKMRKKFPTYPLPILRLARLATAEHAQGQGVGEALLRHAFTTAHELADIAGCIGVVVDAKEGAVGYYEKYGFFELEVLQGESPQRPKRTVMFLELGAIPPPNL